MNAGKIFLVVQGAGEQTPERFLGPAAVYAITLRRNAPHVLARVEVPVASKHQPAALRHAAEEAVRQLRARVGADFDCLAFLSREALFDGLFTEPYPLLVLTRVAKDFLEAEALAQRHFAGHGALMAQEFPELPWGSEDMAAHEQALRRFGDLGLYDVHDAALAPTWYDITRRKKLLLHVCCGPDAAGVVAQLKREYDLVCFWYDPNIQPKFEHDRRLDAFLRVAEIEQVPAVVGEYDADRFLESIKGLERTPEQGAKCSVCYDLRLERAAVEAKRLGCDAYATTLAISPHKVQQKLKNFGALNERKYGVPYLAKNFMKDDGFKESVTFTHDHAIFRQDYCGCWFSLHEGGANARQIAQETGLTKDALDQAVSAGVPPAVPALDYVSEILKIGPAQTPGSKEEFKG